MGCFSGRVGVSGRCQSRESHRGATMGGPLAVGTAALVRDCHRLGYRRRALGTCVVCGRDGAGPGVFDYGLCRHSCVMGRCDRRVGSCMVGFRKAPPASSWPARPGGPCLSSRPAGTRAVNVLPPTPDPRPDSSQKQLSVTFPRDCQPIARDHEVGYGAGADPRGGNGDAASRHCPAVRPSDSGGRAQTSAD